MQLKIYSFILTIILIGGVSALPSFPISHSKCNNGYGYGYGYAYSNKCIGGGYDVKYNLVDNIPIPILPTIPISEIHNQKIPSNVNNTEFKDDTHVKHIFVTVFLSGIGALYGYTQFYLGRYVWRKWKK